MSSTSVLFDVPGPKARSRQRIGTVIGALVVLTLIGLALWRLGTNGQLEPQRWAILVDPASGVPQALGEALLNIPDELLWDGMHGETHRDFPDRWTD